MKNILSNLFKKVEDDINDNFVDKTKFNFSQYAFHQYLSNEFKFQHQNPQYQLRANPNDKVTLGVLLNRIFDIRQIEVSDLYVITDNIESKHGKLIANRKDIWDFDLCAAVLVKEAGTIKYLNQ